MGYERPPFLAITVELFIGQGEVELCLRPQSSCLPRASQFLARASAGYQLLTLFLLQLHFLARGQYLPPTTVPVSVSVAVLG